MLLLGAALLLAPATLAVAHRHSPGGMHRRHFSHHKRGELQSLTDEAQSLATNAFSAGKDGIEGSAGVDIGIDLGLDGNEQDDVFGGNHMLKTKVWTESSSWTGSDFESWNYFNYSDPTHGAVTYVDHDTAKEEGLVGLTAAGKYRQSVSLESNLSLEVNSTDGFRKSVRLTSPQPWKQGELLIGDFEHMPTGCGTWPAFWALSWNYAEEWPKGGEIDIIEGINSVPGNQFAVHTTEGCFFEPSKLGTGKPRDDETCFSNAGCAVKDTNPDSFGPGFNLKGGGVYATYVDDSGIMLWYWPRGRVPHSVQRGHPTMRDFGRPTAFYTSKRCNTKEFFDEEMMIIINTTLMGDWAGAEFTKSGCKGTKESIMADRDNFVDAFWVVNSVKTYQ